jgi:hypothetical protein
VLEFALFHEPLPSSLQVLQHGWMWTAQAEDFEARLMA